MMSDIVRREAFIPAKLTDEAIDSLVENIQQFEKFKQKALSNKDFTYMGDNQYIEKSGWVKLAMAMNVSFSILSEGQRIVAQDSEGEYYTWKFPGRVETPAGRFIQMDGACSSRDEFFSMTQGTRRKSSEIDEKDIIATAQTNCFNRCMAFLCGFGELSGDEMRGKQFAGKVLSFPFGAHKGKQPSELNLNELQHELAFWQKQVADPKNKFAENNKRLVVAIEEAIKAKQPQDTPVETPPVKDVTPPATLPTVDQWTALYAALTGVEAYNQVEGDLAKVWDKYSGEERTALKRMRDKRKTDLMGSQASLV